MLERFTGADRAADSLSFVPLPADAIANIKEQFLDAYSFLRAGMANERTGNYPAAVKGREGEPHTLLGSLVRRQYTNPTTLFSRRRGEFNSEGWAILAGERAALVVGLASMADQFGQVQACCRPGELSLRLATQADGVLLAPGESFASEWGYLQVLPLPDPDPGHICSRRGARQMGGAHAA